MVILEADSLVYLQTLSLDIKSLPVKNTLSSLLGPFVRYKENEALWIRPNIF